MAAEAVKNANIAMTAAATWTFVGGRLLAWTGQGGAPQRITAPTVVARRARAAARAAVAAAAAAVVSYVGAEGAALAKRALRTARRARGWDGNNTVTMQAK